MSNILAVQYAFKFPGFRDFVRCCFLVCVPVDRGPSIRGAIGKGNPCNVGVCAPHIDKTLFYKLMVGDLEDVGGIVVVKPSLVLHIEI